MKILKDLVANIQPYPVKEVFVGVFDTLVLSHNLGLASTVREKAKPHQGIKEAGSLINKNARELSQYVFSDNWLEASLGMAAINSALPIKQEKLISINAHKLILKKGRGKIVGVIGHFPFVEKMGKEFKKMYVFEKYPEKNDLQEEDIPEFLPLADVVAITSTALTNHTFENIMKYIKKGSYVIMLGPTTPISPILFDYGVDAVSGLLVRKENINYVIAQVKEATPYRYIKGKKYITILKEDYFG
ncbi:MAG: DUF364 domain-containing protein [Candidatus Cloacimonetes bacterium]|nr:DUF364 domain-containing protein [Candidatus Cloacimonadota bacterium]